MAVEKLCKNCKCWRVAKNGVDGTCWAHAPRGMIAIAKSKEDMESQGLQFHLVMPTTKNGDGCEHDFAPAVLGDKK